MEPLQAIENIKFWLKARYHDCKRYKNLQRVNIEFDHYLVMTKRKINLQGLKNNQIERQKWDIKKLEQEEITNKYKLQFRN